MCHADSVTVLMESSYSHELLTKAH